MEKMMSSKKKKIISFLLIAIILLFYSTHISKVKEVPIKEDDQIRIMSYNLRYGWSNYDEWKDRKDLIVEQILRYRPDSIGIQEGDGLWMSEDEGLPKMLNGYAYVGVGRDDGEDSGEYAAIFYLEDQYEVLESGNFWLSETPEQPSRGWDAAANRICTWATLKNIDTGEIYTHYNTHLDHKGEQARIKSVELIMAKLDTMTTPLVLTGDFNFFENSSNYDYIVKTTLLDDSKHLASDSMNHGTMNWFKKINLQLLKPIDFCFVSSNSIQVDTYRVDNTYRISRKPVSDHFPIIVDLRILETSH